MGKQNLENAKAESVKGSARKAYEAPRVERFDIANVVRAGGSSSPDTPFSGNP